MQPNNQRAKKNAVNNVNNKKQLCPKCSFENSLNTNYCEICFHPLNVLNSQAKKNTQQRSQPQQKKNAATVSTPVKTDAATVSTLVKKNLKQSSNNFQQELKKPSVLSGLLVLTFAISLWINYFINSQPNYAYSSKSPQNAIELYNSMKQVENVPEGLFNYGGALYFASLVANGLNDAILQAHPNFELRYTKPQNRDQSYANGIKMLLNGELSFAFNGRSLTEQEYSQANLRGISLKQIPIALDGTVFFGNNDVATLGLKLNQVQDIFAGKITNWNQLGGQNLPITPVLLAPEYLEVLGLVNGLNAANKTQYVQNYTQALRKVIATPGSISYASASLVQKQKLIKVFSLAEPQSNNYVQPFIAGEPNLKLFANGTYPLTNRLFVVFRQDGTPDQQAGKAYVEMLSSNEGQKIVEQAGFVPLYGEN